MNVSEVVQQLRDQRGRLDTAIAALEEGDGTGKAVRRRGRPSGSTNKPAATRRKRRNMSAAARKRIADAMKARWAAAKKSGKKRL